MYIVDGIIMFCGSESPSEFDYLCFLIGKLCGGCNLHEIIISYSFYL